MITGDVAIQDDGKDCCVGNINDTDDGGIQDDIAVARYEKGDPVDFIVDTLVDESDGDDSAGELCSLREAILLANAGGPAKTIVFSYRSLTIGGPATITLSLGQLSLTKSMTIYGPGRRAGDDRRPPDVPHLRYFQRRRRRDCFRPETNRRQGDQ